MPFSPGQEFELVWAGDAQHAHERLSVSSEQQGCHQGCRNAIVELKFQQEVMSVSNAKG